MTMIGFPNVPDFWEDGSLRNIEDNRIAFLVGEDPLPAIVRHYSYLWEPGPDDVGTTAFGDNAVTHLKIEERCSPIFRSDNRIFFTAFEGSWRNENTGMKGRYKWELKDGFLFYQNASINFTQSRAVFGYQGYALPYKDWQYSWGWPLGYSCNFSWYRDVDTFDEFFDYCWQCNLGHIDPVWGSEYGLNMQWGWTELPLTDNSYPVSPVSDVQNFFKEYFPEDEDVDGVKTRLLTECIEKLDVGDNNIANVKEFCELVADIRNGSILKLIKDFKGVASAKKGKKLLKAGKVASKTWLAYRYAYKTTVADMNQTIDAATDNLLQRVEDQTIFHPLRAHYRGQNSVWHLKCRCHDSDSKPFLAMANEVRRFGFMPDLHVLWDMIPFSFVVDWFLPVDDIFNSLDHHFYAHGYDFDELLYSRKRSKVISVAGCELTLTSYERWLDNEIAPWSYVSDDKSAPVTRTLNRTADGLSLLVSML